MPSSWFYHTYPKAAARLTKGLLILVITSTTIGYLVDLLFARKATFDPDTQKGTGGKQVATSLVQHKSLLITILIVAAILLCLYFIFERSGILAKFRRWYLGTQSSLTSFRQPTEPRDFNELGDIKQSTKN